MKEFSKKDKLLHTMISEGIPEEIAVEVLKKIIADGAEIEKMESCEVKKKTPMEIMKLFFQTDINRIEKEFLAHHGQLEELGTMSVSEVVSSNRPDIRQDVLQTLRYCEGLMDGFDILRFAIDIGVNDKNRGQFNNLFNFYSERISDILNEHGFDKWELRGN